MHAEELSYDQRRTFSDVSAVQPPRPAPELDRFLSIHDVKRITSLGKTAIYRRINLGTFPKPITLSRTKVAWSARDLAQWQQDQRDAGVDTDAHLPTAASEDLAA